MKHSKAIVIGLLLGNALLVLTLYFQQGVITSNDSSHYQRLADSIANGGFGKIVDETYYPEALRLPGYPFFIFVCQSIFGNTVSAVIVPQILLHIAALWLVFSTVKNALGQITGFIFLALALTFPVVAYSAVALLPETSTLFLLSLTVFLLSKQIYRERILNFIGAGMLLGISFYFRPNILPIAFIISLFIFVIGYQYRRSVFLLVAALLITAAPWTIYNYLNFGVFSPTTAQAGFEIVLYQGTLESLGVTNTNKNIESIGDQRVRQQLSEVRTTLNLPPDKSLSAALNDTSPAQISLAKTTLRQAAFENILAAPVAYFSWSLQNIPRMWISSYTMPAGASNLNRYTRLAWGLIALLLGIIGCLFSVFSKKDDARFFGIIVSGTLCGFSLVLCGLHLETRYANPGKLLLLAAAAVAIHHLWSRIYANRNDV